MDNADINFHIFTWNFGSSKPDKLACVMNDFNNTAESTNQIYVIGLQEVAESEIEAVTTSITTYINDKFPLYQIKRGIKHINKLLGKFEAFALVTYIIYKKSEPLDVDFQTINIQAYPTTRAYSLKNLGNIVSNQGNTKGYLIVNCKYQEQQFTLANIHLPFYNAEFTKASVKTLFKKLKAVDNVIIFGDFNTRSQYNDVCIDTTICDVEFKKKVPVDSIKKLEKKLNNCNEIFKCPKLVDSLTTYDYLTQAGLIVNNGYNESPITFLPSYKINKNTGIYSLSKGQDGRLVGYADRIIFKGKFAAKQDSYKLINCKGNDHFPIALDLKFIPNATGGKNIQRKSRKQRKSRRRRDF